MADGVRSFVASGEADYNSTILGHRDRDWKMTIKGKSTLLSGVLFIAALGTAVAQETRDDEADVILTIERQWEADERGDKDWIDTMLVEEFTGWPKEAPAPRSKGSTKMWDRFSDDQGKTIAHELYFQNIVVHGDVAIAHYLYTSAYEEKEKKKVEVNNGRYTDILVRTDDGWKFIAWHGGDDE